MRLKALVSRSLASCAVAGALALAAPASATTLSNTAWLVPPGGESYTISWVGHTPAVNPASVGGFTGLFGGNPITFWCFDLLHTFSLGTSYDYVAVGPMSGTLATQLSELLNVANANGGYAADRDHSAAFQLAIWNLEYDSDLTLAGGNFSVSAGAARTLADTWLGLLSDPLYANPTNSVFQLNSTSRDPQHQNFITFSTVPPELVPEPPVLPLVLTAFGVIALIEMRRRMRARGG
jgi:hypothetical protein